MDEEEQRRTGSSMLLGFILVSDWTSNGIVMERVSLVAVSRTMPTTTATPPPLTSPLYLLHRCEEPVRRHYASSVGAATMRSPSAAAMPSPPPARPLRLLGCCKEPVHHRYASTSGSAAAMPPLPPTPPLLLHCLREELVRRRYASSSAGAAALRHPLPRGALSAAASPYSSPLLHLLHHHDGATLDRREIRRREERLTSGSHTGFYPPLPCWHAT
uniref:Uncharacterized protein n=1 Tax=Oryza nivara TaxID=4536 RepID=A0A0E0HD17_ORYNI